MLQSLMKNYTRKLELMCRMTLEKDWKEKNKEKHSPAAKRHLWCLISYNFSVSLSIIHELVLSK